MSIADNIKRFQAALPEKVKLVAVSKTQAVETILEAYRAGQKVFGENKVQEMLGKASLLPADIEWHFIGHLQTNKVRLLIPCVSLIHSIDSSRLLTVVDHESRKQGIITSCLLQFHIATEENKFGFDLQEARELLDSSLFGELKSVKISGVMGMATFTTDEPIIRKEFSHLQDIFRHLKDHYFNKDDEFTQISMGMSDDYPIAIEEGSTLVRIGTAIFGERHYP